MMKFKLAFLFVISINFNALRASELSPGPNLNKRISLEISGKPLWEVLDRISKTGGFYFSYSGDVFNRDSLVSISSRNQTVRDILDRIFLGKVDYRERDQYIILRSTSLHFSIQPDLIKTDSRRYLISGRVFDESTGLPVGDASVYERRLLASTLTDEKGYFRMRLRGDFQSVILTVSKEAYRDTSMSFLSTVTIKPEGYTYQDDERSYGSNIVERLGIGRFMVSAKQRIQSLNIAGFMASSPFQASLLPGFSSHGMFSSQVVNKASLNLFGGYTAGVNGIEVAGLFNINKEDVRYFQAGGLANIVGGSVNGFQAAGLVNSVLDSVSGMQVVGLLNDVRNNVRGWQAAGLINYDRRDFKGMQVGGLINTVSGSSAGVQVAGLANVSKEFQGAQVGGLINIARREMSGIQIAGLFNYSKTMKGVQIGLFNFADTSSGFSLGLVNWVNKGYHKISISANDISNTQLAVKTGTQKFYTVLIASANISELDKVYSAGFGFGHDRTFTKRISASAELSTQGLYLGVWDYPNLLSKAQLNMQVKLLRGISFFAGPSYSVYYSDPASASAYGYKLAVAPHSARSYNNKVKGWLGWNAGVILF